MVRFNFLFIVLLGVLMFLFQSCTKTVTSWYKNGKLESELPYKMGKLNGVAKWYYNTGMQKQQVEYKKDKMEGHLITWFVNGDKETDVMYKNDQRNGLATTWDRFGSKLEEVNYMNDTLHGKCTTWFSEGNLRMTGNYNRGLYEGKWIYYNELGLIVGEGNYKDGNGILVSFDLLGRKKREVPYEKNEKNGTEKWFSDNGAIEKEVLYKNGKALEVSVSEELSTGTSQK